MSDLLGDQRAIDLLKADPSVVSGLAGMFRSVAAQAQATSAGLRGAAGDGTWVGVAADGFRHNLGQLPAELGKVTSSYQEASDALSSFEGQLSSIKPQFQSIISQINDAHTQLANAQNQLSSAQNSLTNAQNQATTQSMLHPLSPPKSVPFTSPLFTAVNSAGSAVSNAQGEIASLTSRGFGLLDEFSSVRGTAQGKVSSASHVPPHRSWFSNVINGVSNVLSAGLHFLGNIGSFIIHPLLDLPSAIANFAQDPSLKNLGTLSEDVAGSALLVATVLAPFAAPELISADSAMAGGEVTAAEATSKAAALARALKVADTTSEVAGTVGGVNNVVQDIKGGNPIAALVDAGFMSLPDASNLAGVGENQVKSAEGQVKAWETLQNDVNNSSLPADIKSNLSAASAAGKASAEQAQQNASHYADTAGHAFDYGGEQAKKAAHGGVDHAVGAPHE